MSLSSEQKDALSHYSGHGYREINRALRGESVMDQDVAEKIALIDAAIDGSSSDAILTLYRGVGRQYANALRKRGLRKGLIIKDAAFLSASETVKAARKFESYEPPGTVFKIAVTQGAKALSLKAVSKHPEEKEWLLPRNTRLRFLNYDRDTNMLEVEMM